MYKCDKCGCEHNSRTVCPKCGAPVVIVNEDYLLRRQQWEEQQRNNLRYKKKGEDNRQQAPSRREAKEDGDKEKAANDGIRDKLSSLKNDLASGIRDKKSAKAENRKKREKEKNAEELKDNRREKRLKQRKKRIITAVAVVAGIVLTAAAVVTGINIYGNIDRSDVRYFDGHEVVSVDSGVLLSMDRADENYTLLTYSENLGALFMSAGDLLAAWYDGNEYEVSGKAGELTDEFMFSESGRYLAYVLYSEADEKYSLVIYDLSDKSSSVYDDVLRIKLIAVNDNGIVLYDEIDTTDYSTVVGMNLCAADTSKRLVIAADVTDAVYNAKNESAAFIKNNSLYICKISSFVIDKYESIISDREHILVNEEVLGFADNRLDDAVLYITDAGLWIYDEDYSGPAVSGVDMSAQVYYAGGQNLCYTMADKLYYAEVDKKSSADTSSGELDLWDAPAGELVIDGIKGSPVISEDNNLWCADKEGNLCRINLPDKKTGGSFVTVDTGVTSCGQLAGENGCVYVKDGRLTAVYGKNADKTAVLSDSNIDAASPNKAISSKNYFYFLDSSSVLWKIAKKGNNRESLGFASLAVLFN